MSWKEEEREVIEFSMELGCVCAIVLSVVLTYRHLMFESTISYTNFDDNKNFLENQYLRSNLSYESVKWIVTDGQILGVYEPVALLFKAFVIWLFRPRSIEEEAQCILKTSVCLHVLNSILCVFVCNRILREIFKNLTHRTRWISCTWCSSANRESFDHIPQTQRVSLYHSLISLSNIKKY